jgi:serine/threonine-protein kinase
MESAMTPWSCPDSSRWRAFLDGELPNAEAARFDQHLNDCRTCQRMLDALTEGTSPWLPGASEPQQQAGPALRRVMDELKDEPEVASVAQPSLEFLDPPDRAEELGRLGRYEVLEVVGHGGMGVVLKATDPALNRFVAIKVLAPQWASSSSARQRFAREARATAAVRHDHVVAIHGVDEVKGLPYLVMEYVHGVSLQARLERDGPLEVREVLRIAMQTAAGLQAAHAQGLVHRDVKPSNILLENGVERVKLSDFGLARAVDDASLTQSGVIAGTPQYMSPEQANGKAVDHRSDLFSLGSTLYAMCTGRPPFRASGTAAVLRRVCEDTPRPVREINSDVPEWLEQVIARLHAKRPEQRFSSAGEVEDVLARGLAHLQRPGKVAPPLPAPKGPPCRRSPALALSLAGLFVVLVAFCLLFGFLLAMALYLFRSLSVSTPPRSPVPVIKEVLPPPPPEVPPPPLVAPPRVIPAPEAAPPGRVIPPPRVAPPGLARQAPWAEMANGKLERGGDGKLRFGVDYELRPPANPDLTMSYVWLVRSGERILHEKTYPGMKFPVEGRLSGEREAPRIALKAPVETYLESKRLVPGKLGWQRERISNVVKLAE